jgi:hypothetical protein
MLELSVGVYTESYFGQPNFVSCQANVIPTGPGFSCLKEETEKLLIGAGKEVDMEVNTERT